MHHIFVHKTPSCAWHADICDGVCNVFAEHDVPHGLVPGVICRTSFHSFQIREDCLPMVFHDTYLAEFPDAAFAEFLEERGLSAILETFRGWRDARRQA